MEFEKRKLPTTNTFRAFIAKYKSNPLTKKKIVIAKNSSYPYEKSDNAYVLLLRFVFKRFRHFELLKEDLFFS